MLKTYLSKILKGNNLGFAESQDAMKIIMTGQATQAQIGGYLIALRMKGETVEEIAGSAAAMRSVVNKVAIPYTAEPLIDTAGTGGDGSHSFNISTAAAFVIAGAGKKVAKHGNRAASSKSGSADVLGALGVNLDLTPEQVADCIEKIGIGFMFAPKFHPAMRHAIGPRVELGQRTIFNILGPLTNPAGATHQLLGVFDPQLTEIMAEVLRDLGGTAAFVVHGQGGIDELTTSGHNRVSHLANGKVRTYELDPSEFNLRPATKQDLAGGEPEDNARIMHDLLTGKLNTPLADVVILNAAAALSVEDGEIKAGLYLAREALESGAAMGKMKELASLSQKLAKS